MVTDRQQQKPFFIFTVSVSRWCCGELNIITYCFGHVSFHREKPPFASKIHFVKKKSVNVYNSSDFLTIKILSDVKININNTEFVVILIRFLGAGTLPFCFAGPIQLAHCDACSRQISQGAVPRYSG